MQGQVKLGERSWHSVTSQAMSEQRMTNYCVNDMRSWTSMQSQYLPNGIAWKAKATKWNDRQVVINVKRTDTHGSYVAVDGAQNVQSYTRRARSSDSTGARGIVESKTPI